MYNTPSPIEWHCRDPYSTTCSHLVCDKRAPPLNDSKLCLRAFTLLVMHSHNENLEGKRSRTSIYLLAFDGQYSILQQSHTEQA